LTLSIFAENEPQLWFDLRCWKFISGIPP